MFLPCQLEIPWGLQMQLLWLPLARVILFTGVLEAVTSPDGLCAWSRVWRRLHLPASTPRLETLESYQCLLVCRGWAVPAVDLFWALQACTGSANLCLTSPMGISASCFPETKCHHHKCATVFLPVPPIPPLVLAHWHPPCTCRPMDSCTWTSSHQCFSCKGQERQDHVKILQQERACWAGEIRDPLSGGVPDCRSPSVVFPLPWSVPRPATAYHVLPCPSISEPLSGLAHW